MGYFKYPLFKIIWSINVSTLSQIDPMNRRTIIISTYMTKQDMMKPEIVTSKPTAQVNSSNRDGRKDTALPVFTGKCKVTKGRVFDVCGALAR